MTVFTAGDGATMAGRDINSTTHHTTKKGGRGAWWIVLGILVVAGTGAGAYWAARGDGVSVSRIGAQPGEAGVRETWAATTEAVRKRDAETVCALMTVEYRALLEKTTPGTCADAVGELFSSSESSTLNAAGSGSLQKVTVQGGWAEVAQAGPGSAEPSYSYMERFGDRWRWTHQVLFAEFHPDECPEANWNNVSSRDPRCSRTTLFPSGTP
ncbi:hypothetical protein ABZ565_15450 [Streptomyces sp. NPDC016469]|uniref:hypothetical protein n=1 Tax=Streptomyces sp. NPDC016469 TaxID=3157191 RepID=UPI0033EF06CC